MHFKKVMDKKAKSILFKTYWSSQGWKRKYETDPLDFEVRSKGHFLFAKALNFYKLNKK